MFKFLILVENLGVTAIGKAYKGVAAIHFDGAHFRRDIAARALKNV